MKRKLIIISPLIVVVVILCVILFLTRDKGDRVTLLEGTDYPVIYETDGQKMTLTLDGSKTKELKWKAEAEDGDVVEVAENGEETKGKATYIISPKMEGLTNVIFTRSGEDGGVELEAVRLRIPVFVTKAESAEEGELTAFYREEAAILSEAFVAGKNTEYPFLLQNTEDGVEISFPKGRDSWRFRDPNGVIGTTAFLDEEGQASLLLSRNEFSGESGKLEVEEVEWVIPKYHIEKVKRGDEELEILVPDGTEKDTSVSTEEAESGTATGQDEIFERYAGSSVTEEDGTIKTVLVAAFGEVVEFIDVKITPEGIITATLGKEPKTGSK